VLEVDLRQSWGGEWRYEFLVLTQDRRYQEVVVDARRPEKSAYGAVVADHARDAAPLPAELLIGVNEDREARGVEERDAAHVEHNGARRVAGGCREVGAKPPFGRQINLTAQGDQGDSGIHDGCPAQRDCNERSQATTRRIRRSSSRRCSS